MSDDAVTNSRGYWDTRFAKDWGAQGGPQQSMFFARQLVRRLPQWLLTRIREDEMSAADWGCASGDGTEVFSALMGPGSITGIDFSAVAVAQAQVRYPHIDFSGADWLGDSQGAAAPVFDVVLSSNTLEHFPQPIHVLEAISGRAGKVVILALPYRELSRHAEHECTFMPADIPLELDSGFRLQWSWVQDCRQLPATAWHGEQIFLVYVRPAWLETLVPVPARLLGHLSDGMASPSEHEWQARDEEIAGLRAALAASESRVAELIRQHDLSGARTGLRDRLPTRLRRLLSLAMRLIRVMRSEGMHAAVRLALGKLGRRLSRQGVVEASANQRYLSGQSVESRRVARVFSEGLRASEADFMRRSLLADIGQWERVVLYPLSYPVALTQRPDHVMRCMVEQGYRCLMVTFDDAPPFVRQIGTGIHLTNLVEPVIELLASREIIFYLTAPRFRYLLDYLKRAIVLYDVLDELTLFAHHGTALEADHAALLERADVALFSSRLLMDQNQHHALKCPMLVTNGVWASDFVIAPDERPDVFDHRAHPDEFVLGYHGVITELLDWQLLSRLARIPGLRLVLVGPVAQFAEVVDASLLALRAAVLDLPQVTHVGTVPYEQLRFHLGGFDAGMVPFVVDARTDSVSPLKLFEYMAMGLPVYATPTQTLSAYAAVIAVADRDDLPGLVQRAVAGKGRGAAVMPGYEKVLAEVDWRAQMTPVINRLDALLATAQTMRPVTGRIDIINFNFYDWHGEFLYKGGAERYIHDLACLLRDMGWKPRILQSAHEPFERDHHGIPVVGVPADAARDARRMSLRYRDICRDADLVIASPAELACELTGLNVIGINHGVSWDSPMQHEASARAESHASLLDALRVASTVIAVDTNFGNWVRTRDHALSGKIAYLPNYYDGEVFLPQAKSFSGRLRILFPRRLVDARGIHLLLEAFDWLLPRHDDIDLHIVGQADEACVSEAVARFVARYPGRVCWQELSMEDMPIAYRDSHVALIPTRCSEGTSLACLEAMATRHAVIATHVGGLPNLVIDGFNGLLIAPTAEALIDAVEQLLIDRPLLARMANQGVELARSFEKTRWLQRWRELATRAMR